MKKALVLIILFSCWFCACTNNTDKPLNIIDPDPNYIFGLRLKEELDSISVFSDSIVYEKIDIIEEMLDLKKGYVFRILKADSISYEVLVRPYDFQKNKDLFYLVTSDTIYALKAEPVRKRQ